MPARSPRLSALTLPGGRVEHGDDPFDAMIPEIAEEIGCDAVVERLHPLAIHRGE